MFAPMLAATVAATLMLPAGGAARGPSPAQLKRDLLAELRASGLRDASVQRCRGGSDPRCRWSAPLGRGANAGVLCRGVAELSGRAWKIVRCPRRLRSAMRRKGIAASELGPCANAKRVTRCRWRAAGLRPGFVPYRCAGKARLRRGRGWRIDRCKNREPEQIPLGEHAGPHPEFGFNEDWAYYGKLELLGDAAAAGATTLRLNLEWARVEAEPGVYDWDLYDDAYQRAIDLGMRPIWTLVMAPCWAQDYPEYCDPQTNSFVAPPSAANVEGYAKFAVEAAQRYPLSLAVQVWNEPNISGFWSGGVDPPRYGALLRATAAAVKASGSAVPVITAGVAPLLQSDPEHDLLAFERFWRELLSTGGIGQADAVSHHIYYDEERQRSFIDYVTYTRRQLEVVRRVFREFGLPEIPLWLTEIGVKVRGRVTEQTQAAYMAALYQLMRHVQGGIPVVIAHRLIDTPAPAGFDQAGALAVDGTPKPLYCALATSREVPPPPGC